MANFWAVGLPKPRELSCVFLICTQISLGVIFLPNCSQNLCYGAGQSRRCLSPSRNRPTLRLNFNSAYITAATIQSAFIDQRGFHRQCGESIHREI